MTLMNKVLVKLIYNSKTKLKYLNNIIAKYYLEVLKYVFILEHTSLTFGLAIMLSDSTSTTCEKEPRLHTTELCETNGNATHSKRKYC